jgi:hypothetical protein
MSPYSPMGAYPPPRKKGMSGCVIALLVVGILAVVAALAVGIGVYLFATSSVGKTAIKLVDEAPKLAEKGMNAPGMAEVRALGCDQAFVLDMNDVGELMSDIIDAGSGKTGMPDGLIITCQVRPGARAPSCDDVASTYVAKVKTASKDFMVTVQEQGKSGARCESSYDASGAPISALPTR